eukprot:scaffold16650_cov54-Phaeocystis_antarctica.AAC.1
MRAARGGRVRGGGGALSLVRARPARAREVGELESAVVRVAPGERQQREDRLREGAPRELTLMPPLRLALGTAERLQVKLVVHLGRDGALWAVRRRMEVARTVLPPRSAAAALQCEVVKVLRCRAAQRPRAIARRARRRGRAALPRSPVVIVVVAAVAATASSSRRRVRGDGTPGHDDHAVVAGVDRRARHEYRGLYKPPRPHRRCAARAERVFPQRPQLVIEGEDAPVLGEHDDYLQPALRWVHRAQHARLQRHRPPACLKAHVRAQARLGAHR